MSKESGECKASLSQFNQNFGLFSAAGDEGRCWASGTVLLVKSTHVLAPAKETLQPNKKLAAELSTLWGGLAGWLLPHCLIRLVFQKLTSSQF